MRQSNSCSTPAPRSSAAKQWFEELAQKKRNLPRCLGSIVTCGKTPTTATWSAPEPLKNCCLYTIKTNSKTNRSHVSQPASASKVALMNDLEAHHCITPEQWTMLLCNVSFISASKLSVQELNQFTGIKLLTSSFLEIFDSCSKRPMEDNYPLAPSPSADAHSTKVHD